MVDILFLAKGRKEFTEASWKALLGNTLDPPHNIHVFTEGDYGAICKFAVKGALWSVILTDCGGPVACLNAYLRHPPAEFIAKIDNDTIVPPGWLEACLAVMTRHPEVDLLGLEPWAPDEKLWPEWVEPCGFEADGQVHYGRLLPRQVSHIGGIGVFRRSAFERFGKPIPNSTDGRYGFTEWMWSHPSMIKAFLEPPLPVFLLDHLPFEPWLSLSREYERRGEQRRQWSHYHPIKHMALWNWWKP
jgi:hypothetical protein